MPGMGTLVNTLAIVAGGAIGLFAGKWLQESWRQGLLKANGIAVLFLGMQGALEKMEGTNIALVIILSLALGTLAGEMLGIEKGLESFGLWLKRKSGSQKDGRFMEGFITTSLTVCIGAMAIVGSIQDGIYHDPSILYAKAILDFIIVLVLAGSLGKGCLFSAVPVFLLQMSITLLAFAIQPWLSSAMLENISLVGNILIFCVGLNLVLDAKIKVANMLPSLIAAAAFACIW